MNKKDRENFNVACNIIQEQVQVIADLGDAEQEKFDNLPEGLQCSENGQAFEEKANALTELADEINSAIDNNDVDQY